MEAREMARNFTQKQMDLQVRRVTENSHKKLVYVAPYGEFEIHVVYM